MCTRVGRTLQLVEADEKIWANSSKLLFINSKLIVTLRNRRTSHGGGLNISKQQE